MTCSWHDRRRGVDDVRAVARVTRTRVTPASKTSNSFAAVSRNPLGGGGGAVLAAGELFVGRSVVLFARQCLDARPPHVWWSPLAWEGLLRSAPQGAGDRRLLPVA